MISRSGLIQITIIVRTFSIPDLEVPSDAHGLSSVPKLPFHHYIQSIQTGRSTKLFLVAGSSPPVPACVSG
ncbi:hypothetical protein VTK56DRAFT_6721 [Thermocarpiscus australiensis]